MRLNKLWFVISVLVCCLLMGCSSVYSQEDIETSYEDGYESGYDEGYGEGYYDAYEEAYEKAREELIDELYSVDGYSPLYMSDEIIDALFYLVEEKNGNQYLPEEYAMIVWDFFEANSYYMTQEQQEAFANTLTFCDDADWITRNIVYDMRFPPS